MCPQKQKQGVSCQLLPTCPRVGLKALANSQQTGVGKNLGVQGGVGGCAPKTKTGVSYQLLPTCHRVGLKALANSQQTGAGKNLGVQGMKLPGVGNFATSGPQNAGEPLANESWEIPVFPARGIKGWEELRIHGDG